MPHLHPDLSRVARDVTATPLWRTAHYAAAITLAAFALHTGCGDSPSPDDPGCTDGAREVSCGWNDRGMQTELCEAGQIVDPGTCLDPDVCKDNASRNAACGTNGIIAQRCAVGQWEDDGLCQTSCTEGASGTVSCGITGNGAQNLVCTGGVWTNSGACVDPGACEPGTSDTIDCADGDFGYIARQCRSGQWAAAPCVATSITVSSSFGCAVRNSGHVVCWGDNGEGQLGSGNDDDVVDTPPANVVGIDDAVQVANTYGTACVRTTPGDVYCWGGGEYGALGNNSTTRSLTPVHVSTLANVRALVSGSDHFCALRQDNTVACWGSNANGQVGDGSTTDRLTPTVVPGLTNIGRLYATDNTTCAQKKPGAISLPLTPTDTYCWGDNSLWSAGVLADTDTLLAPTKVSEHVFLTVALAGGTFCGVTVTTSNILVSTTTQNLRCIGAANAEQGDGKGDVLYTAFNTALMSYSSISSQAVPMTVKGGWNNMCALVPSDNSLHCWGTNAGGALGRIDPNLTLSQRATPAPLFQRQAAPGGGSTDVIVTNIAGFAVGYGGICIVTDRGQLACTGYLAPHRGGGLGLVANVPAHP